jgi:hypothetical protein
MADDNVIPLRIPPEKVSGEDDRSVVINLLKALLAEIEEGRLHPTAVFVGFHEEDDDSPDMERFPYYFTGLSRLELLGLLSEVIRKLP